MIITRKRNQGNILSSYINHVQYIKLSWEMILLFSPVLESPFSSWFISWSVFPQHRRGYMT